MHRNQKLMTESLKYAKQVCRLSGAREPFFNRGVKVKNDLFDISEVSIF